ncbi:MAG: hypothetical protein AB6733_12190 [Clostridiaceae bacterium]
MKYKHYTRWDGKLLKCSCYINNPGCDRYKSCEEVDLTLEPYEGVRECMKERKYIRQHGVMKQK